MFVRSVALAIALLTLASAPGSAAAITYSGTLGGQSIILELTEPQDGAMVGRYSYLKHGADIPLHPLEAGKHDVVLAEEAPCTPALCLQPDGELATEPPVGGQFELNYSADASKLTGSWQASASAGVALPVDLTRIGQRSYERYESFTYSFFLWHDYDGTPITSENSPYDYARMQVPLIEGPLQTMNGATYRNVVDPRTKFAFPRVVSLPGAGDTARVNAMLDQQRWSTSLAALECISQDYLSGDWSASRSGNGYSPLGDIDQENISVHYLSASVMTISQGGSSYCGGASPHNHIDYYTYDVRNGGFLDLSRIFASWNASRNDPEQALVDWLIAVYPKTDDYDADYAADCEINQNIAEHLDVGFGRDDEAIFLIGGIDQAACMGAIVSVPLVDISQLLAKSAADYFPSLKF